MFGRYVVWVGVPFAEQLPAGAGPDFCMRIGGVLYGPLSTNFPKYARLKPGLMK